MSKNKKNENVSSDEKSSNEIYTSVYDDDNIPEVDTPNPYHGNKEYIPKKDS